MADDERPDSPEDETGASEAEEAPAADAPAEDAPAAEAAQDEEAPAAEAPAEDAPAAEAAEDAPAADAPAEDAPAAEAAQDEEAPAAEAPAEDAPAAEAADAPAGEADDAPAAEDAPPADAPAVEGEEAPRPKPRRGKKDGGGEEPALIPGEHLEPDLVLEEKPAQEPEFGEYAVEESDEPAAEDPQPEETPQPLAPRDLAADARYPATGKRKTSVARVILKPGSGSYSVNGRPLETFFPRPTLQAIVRQPLETAGYADRMDVIAKIHGGGVAAQAGALRHGVARALVEADPALRTELKRRGFLTRDARVKERKKAGLKKARKRPQFSKR